MSISLSLFLNKLNFYERNIVSIIKQCVYTTYIIRVHKTTMYHSDVLVFRTYLNEPEIKNYIIKKFYSSFIRNKLIIYPDILKMNQNYLVYDNNSSYGLKYVGSTEKKVSEYFNTIINNKIYSLEGTMYVDYDETLFFESYAFTEYMYPYKRYI